MQLFNILKLEIKNSFKHNKTSKIKFIGFALLAIYIISCLLFSICFYTFSGFNTLKVYNLQNYILLLFYVVVFVGMFFSNIYKVKSYLFKNDDILFTMPIKISTIFFARVIWLYLLNLIFTLFILLPAIITYGVLSNSSFMFYILTIIATIFIPMIPTVLSSIIGYIIGFLTSKFGNKKIFETIITFTFVAGIMYIYMNFKNILTLFTDNINNINSILEKFGYIFNNFLNIVTYNSVKDLIIFALINLFIFVIFSYLFSLKYLNILQRLSIIHVNKTNTEIKLDDKKSSILKTLLKKDLKQYFSIPIYIFNTFFGMILLIIISVISLFIDKSVIDLILQGNTFSMFTLATALVSFSVLMTNTTCCSISIENKNFWIIKTLPIKAELVLLSKILVNIILVVPITLISILLLSIAFKFSILEVILLISLAILLNLSISLFGIIINLKFHRFDYTEYVYIVKQSINTFIGMVFPMVIFMVITSLFTVMPISINTFIIYTILTLIVLILILSFLIIKFGIKKYNNIYDI